MTCLSNSRTFYFEELASVEVLKLHQTWNNDRAQWLAIELQNHDVLGLILIILKIFERKFVQVLSTVLVWRKLRGAWKCWSNPLCSKLGTTKNHPVQMCQTPTVPIFFRALRLKLATIGHIWSKLKNRHNRNLSLMCPTKNQHIIFVTFTELRQVWRVRSLRCSQSRAQLWPRTSWSGRCRRIRRRGCSWSLGSGWCRTRIPGSWRVRRRWGGCRERGSSCWSATLGPMI